jgi:hypothetical protein
MEVFEGSATQYGVSEEFIIKFSPKNGDRTIQYTDNEMTVPQIRMIALPVTFFPVHRPTIGLYKSLRHNIVNQSIHV